MNHVEVTKLACELQPGDRMWNVHRDNIYTVLSVTVTNAKVKVNAVRAPQSARFPVNWQFEVDRPVSVVRKRQ